VIRSLEGQGTQVPFSLVAFPAFACCGAILVAFTFLGGHLLTAAHNQSDEPNYLYFAHNLIHGKYAVTSQQADGSYLWHGPGLPLLLAPLVAAHAGIHLMRLIGPACLLSAGILFSLLLRRWVSAWLALAGGIALALFPPFLRMLPTLYSEPLALALLTAAVLALVKSHESGRVRWAVLAGLLAGWMVLTRPEVGWILILGLVLIAGVAVWRRRRTDALSLVCIAVATLVCVPWLTYTASLTHKFPYWESSGGESLYWMAAPTGNGSWESTPSALTDPHWSAERPLFEQLAQLPQVARDARLQHEAIQLILRHPGTYAQHVVDNLSRMIIGGPYSFQATGTGRYVLYAVPDLALLSALLPALWILWRQPRPRRISVVSLLVAFASLNFVIHIPVAAYPRMTTLSIPAALTLIALAADTLLRRAPRSRVHRRSVGRGTTTPAGESASPEAWGVVPKVRAKSIRRHTISDIGVV
jgi:4-amino-4-deoxy-L-arabinose transferase-like glycosyltransferase